MASAKITAAIMYSYVAAYRNGAKRWQLIMPQHPHGSETVAWQQRWHLALYTRSLSAEARTGGRRRDVKRVKISKGIRHGAQTASAKLWRHGGSCWQNS